MATYDTFGRSYVKFDDLFAGQTIELDDGFTCHQMGLTVVREDKRGVYFNCDDGHHYLDGQDDGDGCCVGVYPHVIP